MKFFSGDCEEGWDRTPDDKAKTKAAARGAKVMSARRAPFAPMPGEKGP
jgi:hypothetical protein